jgi:tetrathionate reductase subunit B
MHCDEPPCIEACPLEAIYKRKDGIVVIDDEQCTGCQECITVCPYNAPFYDAEKDVVRKCSLCAHRIDQGLEPFCVICCENEAILFGDLNDPKSKVSQAITQRKDIYNLYPEKGTKPAIYYSPMRTVNSIT